MKYTARNNLVEEKVEQDINFIKEEIFKERKRWGIISLILYGGFSRGEGSVEVEGDNIRPLNDYDFVAVSKKTLPNYKSFRRFVQGIDSRADNYTVDMVIRLLWFMKRLHPSVFYYELKNSGKVLWGEDVLKLMPEIDPHSIPMYDGVCTFFNRLMSLMEAYGAEDRKFIVYQCNKAVLTCMEILLLKAKAYSWSYKERLSIFKSLFAKSFPELAAEFPEFMDMAERATQFKLLPDFKLYPEDDLWEKTARLYFKILEKWGKDRDCPKIYNATSIDWCCMPEAKKACRIGTVPFLLSWLVFKLRKKDFSWRFNLRYQPYMLTYLAAYEWLKAWIEKTPSNKIREYLKRIDHVEYTDDFLDLRDKIILNWKKSSFRL